jgi:NB-ARC domain-containing protein
LDRHDLVMTLCRFTPADFATLVASFPGAASQVSRHGTVPEQAAELVRWAESPTGPGLPAVEREVLRRVGQGPPPGSSAPFVVPFPRNPDFVGRSDDLEALHVALQERGPVGIRPAGLTGMGGIGKTQLAVEYVHRHKADYPGGIFWVNAAEPLARGLAQLGARLRPEARGEPPDRQLQVAFEELSCRPDALLVLDNLGDPAELTRPVGAEGSPLTLACRILFTTRQRDLGRFHPVEVSVLPEGPALQLLLRHDSRHAVRDASDHPERHEAETICRLLGWLPLALELAGAFLGKRATVSLGDYRRRLQAEGCLNTLDSEVKHLPRIYLPTVHEAAVAATLKTQCGLLVQDQDQEAQLLLRVAGQFPEAAVILTRTLGLFAGIAHAAPPGHVSPLGRALDRLHDVRLVEERHAHRVRLHPLVREFARDLIPPSEAPGFRHDCARRVVRAFEDFATLEAATHADGVDVLQQTLLTALDFLPGKQDGAADALTGMLRVFRRESHRLREWDPVRQPNT